MINTREAVSHVEGLKRYLYVESGKENAPKAANDAYVSADWLWRFLMDLGPALAQAERLEACARCHQAVAGERGSIICSKCTTWVQDKTREADVRPKSKPSAKPSIKPESETSKPGGGTD